MLLRRHIRAVSKAVNSTALTSVKNENVDDFSQYMNPPAESEKTEETDYTKSAIQHLTTAELKDLAAKEGLADAENKTGGELKKELIEHFNL
jgi:hypothetical protein